MKVNRILHNRDGQSIVELAVMTPLLLVALYIPADFGIAFFTAHLAQNAVREGARIGAISAECGVSPCVINLSPQACPGSNSVVQEVCRRLPSRLTGPTVGVTLSGSLGLACMRTITVDVTGQYNYFLYQLTALIGLPIAENPVTISRVAELRYELQPVTYSNPCPTA